MHRFRTFLLSRSTWIGIGLNAIAAIVIAASFTTLRTPSEILAEETWGAGPPSASWATAFATGRPWWYRIRPEGFVEIQGGGWVHEVRVPRDEIRTTHRLVRPIRSIGYSAVVGAAIWARSIGSTDVVFDWPFVIRVQQALLVATIAAIPFFLLVGVPPERRLVFLTTYNVCSLVVLTQLPNDARFVVDGLIDSALAVPFALLGAGAFALALRNIERPTVRNVAIAGAASLFLGLCPLVRGELLPPILAVYAFAGAVLVVTARRRLAWLALCAALTLAPIVAYGALNKAVFGRFVPLRMQDGQNLLQPIGQYPNPYGIVWKDEWFERFVAARGVDYQTFEADDLGRAAYLSILRENPELFVENFFNRLVHFSKYFDLPISLGALFVLFVGCWYACVRDERRLAFAVPAVLAVGYLVFFAWTNSDPRPVAPVHYLANAAITTAAAFAVLAAYDRLRAASTRSLGGEVLRFRPPRSSDSTV